MTELQAELHTDNNMSDLVTGGVLDRQQTITWVDRVTGVVTDTLQTITWGDRVTGRVTDTLQTIGWGDRITGRVTETLQTIIVFKYLQQHPDAFSPLLGPYSIV